MPFKLDENMPAFHTVAQRTINTCFVSCVVHGFACFTFEIGSLPTRRVPLSEDVSIKMPVQTHAANCLLPNFREDLRSGSKTFYYSCSLAKPSHNSPTRGLISWISTFPVEVHPRSLQGLGHQGLFRLALY